MLATQGIDERIAQCRKILEENPNSQIFAALADYHRKNGEFETAFRICQNGLRIHPDYSAAHVVMAKINLDRSLYDFAEVEAKKAIAIDGKTFRNELLLAEIYIYKGNYSPAIDLLEKLREENPINAQILRLLEIARRIPSETSLKSAPPEDTNKEFSDSKIDSFEEHEVEEWSEEKDNEVTPESIMLSGAEIPGVTGVLLINNEGLVIDSNWHVEMDETLCGAEMGEVGLLLLTELLESSFGHFGSVIIEAGNMIYYLIEVETGFLLFVAKENTNLGSLRMKVENLLMQISG